MKRCLEPGCRQLTEASRCPAHARAQHRRMYSGAWVRISRQQRALQPVCEDCGAQEDLTTDHIKAGSLAAGVRTLCRRCNASRGDGEKFGLA